MGINHRPRYFLSFAFQDEIDFSKAKHLGSTYSIFFLLFQTNYGKPKKVKVEVVDTHSNPWCVDNVSDFLTLFVRVVRML